MKKFELTREQKSESNSFDRISDVYFSTRTSFNEGSDNESKENVSVEFSADANNVNDITQDGLCDVLGKSINETAKLDSSYDANSGMFCKDRISLIDFILVWDGHDEMASTKKCTEMRKIFEHNLQKEGLNLEYNGNKSEKDELHFIKVTTPRDVLRRYCEILKLKLPMKEIQDFKKIESSKNKILIEMNSYFRCIMSKYYVDQTIFPPIKQKYTAAYSRDKEYLFDENLPDFFSPATRSRIVQFILDRTSFTVDIEDDFGFGIERLINEKAYSAAYPLHDGSLKTTDSMRYLLYTEWASMQKIFNYQPLDYVKEYFGVKIGLYFAWLGFYTHMLLFASIVGLVCFVYSLVTLDSNKISSEVCAANYTMCALCDNFCSTWLLNETCFHSKITYLFDNGSTVFFAIFMSLWATLFLELWKNYSAEITHRWDLTSFDINEENPRPKYLARLAHSKKKIVNFVTNAEEPKVPFWKVRLPVTIFSCSVVLLLISVAMAAVLGVVIYRMALLTTLHRHQMTSNAILLTSSSAALINLACILLFNWFYVWLAEYLTEIELPRTQTEFDNSLTLKIYLLEFVNYYSSIFYIAFFKGKFIGRPGNYNLIFGARQEECSPGGCLLELSIQLSTIMIGKQIINAIFEMLMPLFNKWLNTMSVKKSESAEMSKSRIHLQWVRDYRLVEWGSRSLFSEYLEIILQYGFVTIFVAAFPLAPFFALLNNLLEMRLDAKKLLTMYRRPVSQRVRDIGVWYRILDSVSKLSVITNAFIIAFTSKFIPSLVYRFAVSKDNSLTGFLNHSLSTFSDGNMTCRYPDYREPPESLNKYEHTNYYWLVLTARLAFVVVFQNVVAIVIIVVKWCIPDMSPKLRDKIRREAYVTNEIIIQHEAHRARKQSSKVEVTEELCAQKNLPDAENTDRLNRVLRSSMTAFDFDLEVHGSPMAPAVDSSKREFV